MRQRNPRRLKYNYRARRILANYGKSIVERVLVSVDRDREYEIPKPENGVVACLPYDFNWEGSGKATPSKLTSLR
jgi:hypothetical protein